MAVNYRDSLLSHMHHLSVLDQKAITVGMVAWVGVALLTWSCLKGVWFSFFPEDDLTTQIWVAKWSHDNTFGWPF